MKKIILAIPAEAAAIPVKPNTAAIIATTRKINAQPSKPIFFLPYQNLNSFAFINILKHFLQKKALGKTLNLQVPKTNLSISKLVFV